MLDTRTEDDARRLGGAAALLFTLGLVTGFLVAGAMTGKVGADAHAMLASHLNALLGALWMVAVAWSLPLLSLDERWRGRLVTLTIVCNYANWLLTVLKAFLRIAGLEATGVATNDAIFGLLTALVVLPSLAAAGLWVKGFRKAA